MDTKQRELSRTKMILGIETMPISPFFIWKKKPETSQKKRYLHKELLQMLRVQIRGEIWLDVEYALEYIYIYICEIP